MVAEWDEEREFEAALAAFEALTDETRQATVEALYTETWDAVSGATFTDLREAVGVEDPGRFHYHLDKLSGTFATRRDDEYWPLYGRLRDAFNLAACHHSLSIDHGHESERIRWTAQTRYTCPHCERFLDAVYVGREALWLTCPDHETVFWEDLPSGRETEDPQEWVDDAVRRYHQDAETLADGRCLWCRGPLDRSLRYGRLSYTSHDTDAVPWPVLWGRHDCRDCPLETWRPLAVALGADRRVRRFFHARGVDLRREPTPRRYVTGADTTHEGGDGPHPERATLTYRVGDDTLTVSVDAELAVESVDVSEADSPDVGAPVRDGPEPAADDDERTVYDPTAAFHAAPLATDETVCVVADRGNCHALDRATGEVRWRTGLDGSVSSPVAADGVVSVADRDGTVTAVDERTGGRLWSTDFDGCPTLASPAGDGTVSLVVPETGVVTVDAQTGEVAERVDHGAPRYAPTDPTVADGRVFIGSPDGIRAVDPASETAARVAETAARPTDFAVVDGALYAGTVEGVTAFDAATGDRQWTADTGGIAVGIAAASDPVSAGVDGDLTSLDAATGETRWRVALSDDRPLRPPAVGDGSVFAADQTGTLGAVDAETGEVLWTTEATDGHRVRARPAVREGIVYLAGLDGRVVAVDAESGKLLWRTTPVQH